MADQLIALPFVGGVDTKRDSNVGAPDFFSELENAEFRKPNALTKRRGYTTVSAYNHGLGLGTGVDAIASTGLELLTFGKGKVISYTTANGWREVGKTAQIRLDERHVSRSVAEVQGEDVAVIGNVAFAVWHDGTRAYYGTYDVTTGVAIVPPTEIAGSNTVGSGNQIFMPRVVADSTHFYVLLPANYSAGTVTAQVEQYTASGNYLTSWSLQTGVYVADIQVVGSTIVVALGTTSGVLARAYPAGNMATPSASHTVNASTTCRTISLTTNGTGVSVAWADRTTTYRVQMTQYLTTGLTGVSNSSGDLVSTTYVIHKVAVHFNTTTQFHEIFVTALEPTSNIHYLVCSSDAGGTSILFPISAHIPFMTLAGKPWVVGGVTHVPALYYSFSQETLLVLTVVASYVGGSAPWTFARSLVGRAYFGEVKTMIKNFATTGMQPAHTAVISSTRAIFALERRTRTEVVQGYFGGAIASVYGASSAIMTTGARPSAAQLGDTTLIASGSILYAYDGAKVVECGFHVAPEIQSVASAGAGSAVAAGTRQYTVVYSWYDRNGRIHRSAPALPVSITLGSAANVNVQFRTYTVPTDRVVGDIQYEIYRTLPGGTTYYRVFTKTDINPQVDPLYTYTDTTSDAAISSQETLYTTDGTLDAVAPPNARAVAVHGNRAWVLSGPRRLYFSHQTQDGVAPTFSDVLYVDVERDVVAFASMDERLIIFCADRIYSLSGNGPNAQGQLNDYERPLQIASDVGCVNPDSVVLTADGLMFQSQRGIMLLDRSYQVQPIGLPVDGFLDGTRETLTITGAAVVPDRGQVRFVSSQGRCLVYDQTFRKWTTFTNYASAGCTMWNGQFVHARPDGTLCLGRTAVETSSASVFRDGSDAIVLRFKTPWFSFGGAGLHRVKRAHVLGTWRGPHALSVSVWADQSSTPAGTALWSEPAASTTDYAVRVHIGQQKARSFQVEVKDEQSALYWGGTGANEGCELSKLELLVTPKAGPKTSDVKTIGV